jgi:hypothetical protein
VKLVVGLAARVGQVVEDGRQGQGRHRVGLQVPPV